MRKLFAFFMLLLGMFLGSMNVAQAAPKLSNDQLAAAVLGPTQQHYSGRRHKMAKPGTPHELAMRIRTSLKVNPLGRAAIDGPNCRLACATPADYLEALRAPDSMVRDLVPTDINKLADFFDNLILNENPPDVEYFMVFKGGDGSASSPIYTGLMMTRKFHKANKEPCYGVKVGNEIVCVIAYDCSNVVLRKKEASDCVRLLVLMHKGDVLRGAPMTRAGPMPVNSKCPMLIREPGSDESAYPPTDKCYRADCDFSRPAEFLHMKVLNPRFSFQAEVTGWAVIYLPVEVTRWKDGVIELCIEPADGRKMAGKDIHWTAYHNGDGYVVFSKNQVPVTWDWNPNVWAEDGSSDYNANRSE